MKAWGFIFPLWVGDNDEKNMGSQEYYQAGCFYGSRGLSVITDQKDLFKPFHGL